MTIRITENLDVNMATRRWECHHCSADLGPADANYKRGCLIAERSPHEVWQPLVDEQTNFSYREDWIRIVEFYCPSCGWLIELEMLPPGHPITHDIELDLDALARRTAEPSPSDAEGSIR
ncbi:MAG: acetone carboxylase subunit gamma [Pseudoclavibacter sp.]